MSSPVWVNPLAIVLGHPTSEITKISPRTGNEYTTDAILDLKVLLAGSIEALEDGKYRYPIADHTQNLEYVIKAPNKVDVKFGTMLHFKNVVGGQTSRGGWYSADSVEVVQKNA
ncbi:hypothetical protein NRIC_00370 [Enterococcus florum]|uniref:Uncharacterized protein n=1 Tax=Enterococcus florum TaxID=2480627 RepID=A0A4P5P3V5_9ENTE|nr:hypothetical protein [Enterococcus florum]GCF92146.1 hypothetical protein NRIC_00370 [Enterococcus florum]